MGTLGALFDLSRSSLTADQAALNATANNVANQNTVGYTRQVVTWQTGDSVTLGDGSVAPASGPTVAITSRRDRVLEQRVQQQTQTQAETSARADVYANIESVFSLSGSSASAGSTQIGTALNSFFSSLTALATSPSDAATRAGVLSAASTLASTFNTASSQLGQVQQTVRGELTNSVAQVNALTTTIASLNGQIGANSPNADAGALEDQRQQAITQLSALVGLDQVQTEGNGITLTTTGGSPLVSGSKAYALFSASVGAAVQVHDGSGADISAGLQGGSIGGQLSAQNTDLPSIQAALDAVAFRVGTAVNAANQTGVDATGAPGAAVFALGASAAGPSAAGAAAALSVLPTSGSAFAAAAIGEGSLGNTNANALAALSTATGSAGQNNAGQTIAGQFAALLGTVGAASSSLTEATTAQAASLTQLTTQRDSLSGVALDEEAANLTQYQRAYEAAAKLFSVLDTLMTAAINLGQQTTYS